MTQKNEWAEDTELKSRDELKQREKHKDRQLKCLLVLLSSSASRALHAAVRLILCLWFYRCGAVRTSEAHCAWVIPFLTLHASHSLNSPTSQPLANVGISILAFVLFVLFACVIRDVLRFEWAARRWLGGISHTFSNLPQITLPWVRGATNWRVAELWGGRKFLRQEHPQQIFPTCCLPFAEGQKLTFHWSHYRQWHFISQDLS